MKAVILVGGFGTRLRPLTCTRPKQLLPLGSTTLIEYIITRLTEQGIKEIVLAAGYIMEKLQETLEDGSHLGASIHYSHETTPLGTAGPLRQAEGHLRGGGPFLVLNGDIISDMDYHQLLKQHRKKGAIATIALHQVDDPSRYGVVDIDPDGRIRAFIEKPAPGTAPSNLINAGCYVLEEEVLDLIPRGVKTSIEREIFPQLCSMERVYGWEHRGLWIDTGTPASYLEANRMVLAASRRMEGEAEWEKRGVRIVPPVIVDMETSISPSSIIGPNVTIRRNVTIGPRTRIRNSIIFEGAVIGEGVVLEEVVVGQNAVIGDGVYLGQLTLVGDEATIDAGMKIPPGARICPHRHIKLGDKPLTAFC